MEMAAFPIVSDVLVILTMIVSSVQMDTIKIRTKKNALSALTTVLNVIIVTVVQLVKMVIL